MNPIDPVSARDMNWVEIQHAVRRARAEHAVECIDHTATALRAAAGWLRRQLAKLIERFEPHGVGLCAERRMNQCHNLPQAEDALRASLQASSRPG